MSEDREQYMIDGEGGEFLRWEAASRDSIEVKRIYVDIAGDLVAGILLSQLLYWWLPDKRGDTKLRIQRDGKLWLAKERTDWWAECRISAKQFDRASTELEERGLIEKKLMRFAGETVVHLSINLTNIWQGVKRELTKGQTGDSPKVKREIPQRVNHYTETTTEITSENKEEDKGITHSVISHFEKALTQNNIRLDVEEWQGAQALAVDLERLVGPAKAETQIYGLVNAMVLARDPTWGRLRRGLMAKIRKVES